MKYKIKKILLLIFTLLVPLGVGLYFRFYPFFYRTTSELYDQATMQILAKVQKAAGLKAQEELKHIPQPAEQKTRQLKHLTKRYFDKILHDERDDVQKNIQLLYRKLLKENSAAQNAYPYLLEADPYNYYNLTQKILEQGALSRSIKGSKYFNERMLAPLGHWEPLTLHPYVGYGTYAILKIFTPQIPLMLAVSFTPIFLTIFIAFAFSGFARFLRLSALSSATGLSLLLLSPIFAKRSAFGWYDNDPYNILFPFLILWPLLKGLNSESNFKKNLFWITLAAGLMALYTLFWHGWMYLISILLLGFMGIMIYQHILLKDRSTSRQFLLLLSSFFFITVILINISFGPGDFIALFKEGWQAFKNFLEPQLTLWPDVYIGVGELRKVSGIAIISEIGWALSILCAIGFISQFVRFLKKNLPSSQSNQFIVLSVLLVLTFLMALGARRFALICVVPFSIFATFGIEFLTVQVNRLGKSPRGTYIILGLFFIATLFFPLRIIHKEMFGWRPIYNDVWDRALKQIRDKTPPESIISTWWPPGHFITGIAERRVTFDGATINFPQAYWMANVFLAQDEISGLGILRMLNNSANQATEYLQAAGMKLSMAVDLLKDITKLSRRQAELKLKTQLTVEQINHLLSLTHATPPPSYLFIYKEQLDKHLELSFIGRWNFRKVEQVLSDPSLKALIPKRNSPDYIHYLWDLAGGPLRNTEALIELGRRNDSLLFDKGVAVNIKELASVINSKNFGKGVPQNVLYFDGETLHEKKMPDANLKISVLVMKEDSGRHHCQLIDYPLAKSLLFRLGYYQGRGLKYLEPVIHESDPTHRTDIYVYRINWEIFLNDLNTAAGD